MVHRYKQNGFNIVIDVNSGAIHVVDDTVYDLLAYYNEEGDFLPPADLEGQDEEARLEIEELRAKGLLFSLDIYDEVIEKVNLRQPVVKAICLHVAHDCNLKCRYCFAEEGEYHGRRGLMSADVGKAAIDFLIKNSGQRKNLEVDFFGGEPLMNFDVVKEIVEYARDKEKIHNKNFRFTLTTNGVLLNEEIEAYLNTHMHNVVLSLDGRKAVHDRLRKTAGGQGSYDLILPKLQSLVLSRGQKNYYVRGTYTRHNQDFAEDVLHLANLGFSQISLEPVIGAEDEDYAIQEEHLPALFEEYESLARIMLDREKMGEGFNFFHFMVDLSGGPCVAKRLTGCGAGTEYLAVTPEGDLYPCHQFTGVESLKMGTVFEGVRDGDLRREFEGCNVYTKEDCKACFAKFYCSGGCAANAYNLSKNILSTYKIGCALQKKRIECAIMMKAAQSEILNRF